MEYHSGGSLPLLGRPRYCPGANANGGYLCETGHCCGESGCCTYYYELWWFWLLWTALILFSCCCAYRHRRAKLRLQQQQRQRDISLLAYQGASSFPSSMLDLSFLASLKLPSYEEVAAQPSTPPPPYSSVFTAPRYPQPPRAAHPHLLSQHPGAPQHPPQHPGARPLQPLQPLSDGPSSLSSDNSSSCSCDSCCPSSPCSSSLSAPVTYETDTSHASTPSEAAPLALDPVTVETISAAAARLAPKDTVAILIERADPVAAAAAETTKAQPDLDVTLPVGIKQQLDVAENLDRTLENTSLTPPRTLSLILDSSGGNADTNPSLVPISAHHSPDPSSPSQGTAHFSTKPAGESVEEARSVQESPTTSQAPDDGHTPELSISVQTVAPPESQTSGELSEDPTPEPIVLCLDAKTGSPAFAEARGLSVSDPSNSERPAVLSPGVVAVDESETPPSKPTKAESSDAASPTLDRETLSSNLEVDSKKLLILESPSADFTRDRTHPESPESVSMPRPSVSKGSGSREKTSAQPAAEAESLDVTSPTFDQETERQSAANLDVETNSSKALLADSKVLNSPELCPTPPEPPRVSTSMPEPSLELPPSTPRPAAKAGSLNVLSPTLDLEMGNLEVLNSEQSLVKSTQDPTYLESPAFIESPELFATPPELPRLTERVSTPDPRDPGSQFYPGLPPHPAAKAGSLNVLSPTLDRDMAKLEVEINSSKADSKVLNSEQSLVKDPTYLESPAFVESPELPRLTERVSMSIPDPGLQFYPGLPPAGSSNVLSPSLDVETGKLNLEVEQCCSQSPDAGLFFPSITIHADPPSFAASPCSIPSPSQSPPPGSMLLLDPLAALQPSDRSASASSGHASSLSPSPRNTQSPPKQTLFSPCVDVFEPVVDPDWEDEESEGPADEEYCEDSDVAADESQYRHRRLTGDSGIEVCRCHVEDEDEDGEDHLEMEKKKPDERKCAGGAALHDSADCPVRSRGSSDDDAGLCDGETSPDEVAIPVETA